MHPENWCESLLGTRAKVRILRFLTRDVATAWTEREVARAVGMSQNTVNLAVRELRDEGALDFRRVGKTHSIRLKSSGRPAEAIVALFAAERATLEVLETSVRGVLPPTSACYLHGSTARADVTPGSDLDFLVASASQEEADETAHRVREAVQRIVPAKVDIVALGAEAARKRMRSPLIRKVLRGGKRLSLITLEELV